MSDTDSDQSQSIPEQALVLQINQFLHMADVAMHEYKSSLAREMRTTSQARRVGTIRSRIGEAPMEAPKKPL